MNVAEQSITYTLEQSTSPRHSGEGRNSVIDSLDIWSAAQINKKTVGRGNSKKQQAYGIKRLRELILDLAVRGKLVPQDLNEEPASVLLKKIAEEKMRLIKEKKIKKQKELPVISDSEMTFSLPVGWEWVKLGQLMEMYNGRAFKQSEWSDEGLPIVRIQNLNNQSAPFNYFNDEVAEQHVIDDGTFLISWSGTPGTSFGAFVWDRGLGALNQHINKCLVFGDQDNLQYLKIAVNSCMDHLISKAQGGVGLKHVTKGTLNNVVFGFPPLAEQHRIVAKVDELMALCDQLEQQQTDSLTAHQTLVETLLNALVHPEPDEEGAATATNFEQAWQRIAEHFDTLFTTEHSIDQLKQTILQLAVMGKLVPQNPDDEPASVLLEKIAKEKARLIKEEEIKKQKALPKITDEEKPFELPRGWVWSKIGDASLSTDYGLSDKSSVGEVGVPVLAMGHIQSGKVLLETQKVVSESVESLPVLFLKNRDLLYNRTNSAELVGKTGIYIGDDDKYTFASYLIRIRTDKNSLLPEFINLNMLTPLFRETQIVPHLKQQCGQANVNGTIMKNMLIAIPPKAELQAIIEKVDELMTICDTLKARLQEAQTTQVHLADAIVKQAVA